MSVTPLTSNISFAVSNNNIRLVFASIIFFSLCFIVFLSTSSWLQSLENTHVASLHIANPVPASPPPPGLPPAFNSPSKFNDPSQSLEHELENLDPDLVILNLRLARPDPPLSHGAPSNLPASLPSSSPLNPSWDANRLYGIVIDAGSSGSRIQLYSWIDPRIAASNSQQPSAALPAIQKAHGPGKEFQFKVEPGISSFVQKYDQTAEYLRPLLDFAANSIPKDKHLNTPIYLFATAGMRLVAKDAQREILAHACSFVQTNYAFSIIGGCRNHFRVISGELEGIFGWLTVNYLKGGLVGQSHLPTAPHSAQNSNSSNASPPHQKPNHSFGFLDMGGASAQIAFEPTYQMAQKHFNDLWPVRMRFLDGSESVFYIFVSTFLGFGSNQARTRHVDALLSRHQQHGNPSITRRLDPDLDANIGQPNKYDVQKRTDRAGIAPFSTSEETPLATVLAPNGAILVSRENPRTSPITNSSNDPDEAILKPTITISDPCLPNGLILNITHTSKNYNHQPFSLEGSGMLRECMRVIKPLLNKHLPCPDDPCLFNGVHAPISDFGNHRFLGVSEFWYTSSEVFGLGGRYDYKRFFNATESFCVTPWESIMQRHLLDPYPNVDNIGRLQNQCFKGAWMMNMLHEGFGLPTALDASNPASTSKASDRNADATADGLPFFESIDEIGEFSVSWTLGVILFYVSSTIPPKVAHAQPEPVIKSPSNTVPLRTMFIAVAFLMLISVLLTHAIFRMRVRRQRRSSSILDLHILQPHGESDTARLGIGVAMMRSPSGRLDLDQ